MDGIVIEELPEETTIEKIMTDLSRVEYVDETGIKRNLEITERHIEIKPDKRDKTKAIIELGSEQAWTAIEILRRKGVKVGPYIIGDKLLQRRLGDMNVSDSSKEIEENTAVNIETQIEDVQMVTDIEARTETYFQVDLSSEDKTSQEDTEQVTSGTSLAVNVDKSSIINS